MVTCNMNSGPRDRKPAEAVRENPEEYRTGNSNHLNHNHAPPTTINFRDHHNDQFTLSSNSNANLEETPMEVSPTVRQAVHLKMDYHDHPEEVHVTLYVKKIIQDSLKIEFDHHSLQVTFKTRDQAFLNNYVAADEQDYFQWEIETCKQITPKKCTHRLKPTNLEIKLVKANFGKWESLESTGSSPTGRNLEREKWISLAPPKTLPRPPAIADGNDNANEYGESRSALATASSSPAVPTRVGYTGLGNLGNTCYMNAVLQCLANTTYLRNYFINKSFQRELNTENPLGFKGQLAVAFAIVVRQLWNGQQDSIEPSHLKTLLAKKASLFSGHLQHDAQEFMAFLLDGLHEDLNRVKNKPLTSPVESDGRPDAVVAEEAWRVYKMRNDSIIVDFFQGQYKSTLVCPECDKVSVTFDPFLYLALPLPPSKSCFNVTMFFGYDPAVDLDDSNLSPGAVKLSLWLDPNERVEHLKREIKQRCARRLRRKNAEIEVIQVLDGRIRRWLLDQAPLSSLNNTGRDTSLFAFETAPCTGEPQIQIAVIQRLLMPPNEHTHCAACKRESTSLNRCLKCYSVAYCDKICQKTHWNAVHRTACRVKPQIIGEPFVISLPSASLTYDRLYKTMLHYARFSVEVTPGVFSPSTTGQNDSSPNRDMDSSAASAQSLPSTPSPPRRRSSNSGAEDAGSLESASDGQQQEARLFFIKPIDSQGQSVADKKRLEDRGDEVLDLDADESPVFLALDWRNNPQTADHCVITPLDDVRCEALDEGDRHHGQRDVTLQDCLHQFMQPEVLTREEAWYCPKCKEHREATKQMSLWRLPEVLTIQLKRFSFRNLLWRDKIDQKVVFPIQGLDLSPYLSTTVASGPDAGAVYDLFAVVNHYGSILYGHYTAFARCPANDADNNRENLVDWRCMDDRQVRDVSEASVVTPAAYLLLYMRRKSGPDNAAAASAAASTGASGSLPTEPASHLKYSDPEEID